MSKKRLPNPSGSKNLRRWFKNAHDFRGTAAQAAAWYAALVEKFPLKYPLGDRRNKEATP